MPDLDAAVAAARVAADDEALTRLGRSLGDLGSERVARAAVEAAAPLIEAAVRAQIAEEIEILEHTREEVRDRVLNGLSVDWSSGYDTAVSEAVKIVRGV